MLDQTMKTSSNLKWIWSFAFYIDGSWRELNMLGRTMEIQRNLEWICGERNQYYWNMKKGGGYRKRKWNENNLRCLIRIVLSNIVLKITNCLLPFIVLLSSIRKLQISYMCSNIFKVNENYRLLMYSNTLFHRHY